MGAGDPQTADSMALSGAQSDVYERLGRCMVRLQQCELILKDLLSRHQLEGPAAELSAQHDRRVTTYAQKTLGQLVADVHASLVVDEDPDDGDLLADVPAIAPPMVGVRFVLRMNEDEQEDFRGSLAALVKLRNDLVHGFLAIHDIWTADGCAAAASYLEESYRQVDRHFGHLRETYKIMRESYAHMASLFEDPQFLELFFHGIQPNGGVDWPVSTAFRLLRHAEGRLARDGWTSLRDATTLIRSVAPDHTPRRYGCSTWRQVLHEARPLFLTRRVRTDGRTPGDTLYRSALAAAE